MKAHLNHISDKSAVVQNKNRFLVVVKSLFNMPNLSQTASHDVLIIEDLEIFTFIGVYEWEHQQKQKLLITIKLEIPSIDEAALHDDLSYTLDAVAVCDSVIRIADERPRKLVETLAKDIVNDLFRAFPVVSVAIEVKKFARKDARSVSLRIKRTI